MAILKPIPPRPEPEYEYKEVSPGYVFTAIAEGIQLYVNKSANIYEKVCPLEFVQYVKAGIVFFTRKEIKNTWAKMVIEELGWKDVFVTKNDEIELNDVNYLNKKHATKLAKAILKAAGETE